MVSSETYPFVYDVIGIGFGPANLAVAGALLEQPRELCPISAENTLFIDRYHEFRWHPGMLLPGSRMQISFLKDLATLRSTQSPITFLAYLHAKNRLVDFINLGGASPTRKEYSDYLAFVAQYVRDRGVKVAYGEDVIAIEDVGKGIAQVHSKLLATGEITIRLAKNIIISPGGLPQVPRPIQALLPNPRIIHTSEYLYSVEPMLAKVEATTRPVKIAVVGAGQSAVEVLLDVHSRLTNADKYAGHLHDLHLIIRGGSLKSNDGGPFVNEVYNPESVDIIYNLPCDAARKRVLADYHSTNYGAVSPRTLSFLYDVMYDQRIEEGIPRRKGNVLPTAGAHITIVPCCDLVSAEIRAQTSGATEALSLAFKDTITKDVSEVTYDAVICATGYERHSWMNLLKSSNLGRRFGLNPTSSSPVSLTVERDVKATTNGTDGHSHAESNGCGTNTLRISRRYRLLPTTGHASGFSPRIYLQGCAEETHGLSETLLSVAGIRAGELVEDLCSGAV